MPLASQLAVAVVAWSAAGLEEALKAD